MRYKVGITNQSYFEPLIVLSIQVFSSVILGQSHNRSRIYPDSERLNPGLMPLHLEESNQIHFTSALLSSVDYLSFLQQPRRFRILRKQSSQVGDTLSFYVRNIFDQSRWNHSEMVRYTRIYKGEDTGKPGAEILTLLKRNEIWMRNLFGLGL